jgi:hypothetical protein
LINVNGKPHLLVLGSASGEQRKKVILMPLESLNTHKPCFREYYDGEFVKRLVRNGIFEVNIEGATAIGNYLVLANRGNNSNQTNHLIITSNYSGKIKMKQPLTLHSFLFLALKSLLVCRNCVT